MIKVVENKTAFLTGKVAVSTGISVEVLLEFVDEDCCQAEQLVEFDMAVSFGITPRIIFYSENKIKNNGTILKRKKRFD
jgi:hypothetical protein